MPKHPNSQEIIGAYELAIEHARERLRSSLAEGAARQRVIAHLEEAWEWFHLSRAPDPSAEDLDSGALILAYLRAKDAEWLSDYASDQAGVSIRPTTIASSGAYRLKTGEWHA